DRHRSIRLRVGGHGRSLRGEAPGSRLFDSLGKPAGLARSLTTTADASHAECWRAYHGERWLEPRRAPPGRAPLDSEEHLRRILVHPNGEDFAVSIMPRYAERSLA